VIRIGRAPVSSGSLLSLILIGAIFPLRNYTGLEIGNWWAQGRKIWPVFLPREQNFVSRG
jgi:hypothetical protein